MNRLKKTLSITNTICSFFLFAFIFFSCGKSLPTLDGIDLKSWHEDKNGCSGKRLSMEESIVAQHEKLLALGELQIVELLGKPDVNELSKRNQKFYYYYLQSAKECSNSDSTIAPKRLAIRFNAMGLAKEVQVE
jgi:hypothetical protein